VPIVVRLPRGGRGPDAVQTLRIGGSARLVAVGEVTRAVRSEADASL
jgi:hypothetical protein